jgi:multicomponent Na+:H+ antiporter subunit D
VTLLGLAGLPANWLVETLVSPSALVLVAGLVAIVAPRVAGRVGLVATAVAALWTVLAPSGVLARATLLGFEVHPVAVDELARLVALVFSVVGFGAVLYATETDAAPDLIGYALAYVGASLGAVLAGDWLTLVVWWEVMAVASTLLVWQHGGAAVRSGLRYALLHGLGGGLLMLAVAAQGAETGSLLISEGLATGLPRTLALLGIGVNVGFVGLHAWLPDTYPVPHVAASVFLSVYTTKTGVYTLLRAIPEGHLWVAYMGLAMAAYGVLFALFADDVRELLAYSIQSQVGYMVAAAGLGTTAALQGAAGHIANHILYKALLFVVAGVLVVRTGREHLSELGGLGRAMPWTAGAFLVAALAIAGVPGLNGFATKGLIADAAHELHLDRLYWGLTLVGLGTGATFAKMGWMAFLREAPDDLDSEEVDEATPVVRGLMLAMAGACVVFGLQPDLLWAAVPGEVHAATWTPSHVGKSLGVAAGALGLVAVLRPVLDRVRGLPDVDALYLPVAFYTARAAIRLLHGAGRAVDRGAARLGEAARRIARAPLPGERAGIGGGVLLLVGALTAALAVALL